MLLLFLTGYVLFAVLFYGFITSTAVEDPCCASEKLEKSKGTFTIHRLHHAV